MDHVRSGRSHVSPEHGSSPHAAHALARRAYIAGENIKPWPV
jgi:hypothetical protein